jgi:hypothetical protein
MMRAFIATLLAAGTAAGCNGSESNRRPDERPERAQSMTPGSDQGRCDADAPDREMSEYDTSGDAVPDVRKVFLRIGQAPQIRLVMICREADLNGDGTKDIVRYYTDEGRPLREEADRNFDGQLDELTFFENGRIARIESDSNYDGRVDTKVFYEAGTAIRSERDIAGRSTATDWNPDRWEYFENGRMVRMGTDLDGDGRVDRWDRDEDYRRQIERDQLERERREQAQDQGEEPVDDEDAESEDSGAGEG